ncbi:hypothetical protein [uncultured Microbulbifer sp.]|uniref:hypothetical protein n=1 Tax=uncultured Microbulbifer sp. TaxID=348147 RepID=UPI00262CA344|nr:hypothetical protein [uncultured Microbulbifer sp.]
MKVATTLFILFTLSGHAYAEKIRGIDLGDKCSYVKEVERSLGSKEIDKSIIVNLRKGDTLAFNGVHDGYPVLIMYSCINSIVTSQLLNLKYPDSESASFSFQKYQRYLEPEGEIVSVSENKGEYPRIAWKLKSGATLSINTTPLSSSVSLSIIKQDLEGQL